MDPAKRYVKRAGHPPELTLLCEAIEANLDKELTIKDFAQITGLSVDKIYRLGREHFPRSIGPHEWYCLRRLYEARKLLMLSKKIPVKEVAARFGFKTASLFGKRYKQQFHETPGKTRSIVINPDSLR